MDRAPLSGIDRAVLSIVVGAITQLWAKVTALVESDEEPNARIQKLEAEVAALKSGVAGDAPVGGSPGTAGGTANCARS